VRGTVTKQAWLTVDPKPTVDTLTVPVTTYEATTKVLRVEATSTSSLPILRVYVASTGAQIGTLSNNGGGKYSGSFTQSANPVRITIKSTYGGRATVDVK
jgi:hypothetical protein